MIMKGRAPLRLPFVGLFCLALVGAATLPAWATSAQNPAQPQTPPPTTPVVVLPATTSPAPSQTQPAQAVPIVRDRRVVDVPVTVSVPARSRSMVATVQTPTRQTAQTPPPTPKTPPTVTRKVAPVQDVKTTPAPAFKTVIPTVWIATTARRPANMPADGLALLDNYDKDREAIQKEIDQKLTARREAAVKALQDLQDQYTKAGKLDEAVIIRDYLRSGGPDSNRRVDFSRTIKR